MWTWLCWIATPPAIAKYSQRWMTARLTDRVDAVVAHEYAELTAPVSLPRGVPAHDFAVANAMNTTLKITDTARQILQEYAAAKGF